MSYQKSPTRSISAAKKESAYDTYRIRGIIDFRATQPLPWPESMDHNAHLWIRNPTMYLPDPAKTPHASAKQTPHPTLQSDTAPTWDTKEIQNPSQIKRNTEYLQNVPAEKGLGHENV